jgi:hypothetical protein
MVRSALLLALLVAASACATPQPPIEVTRFVDPAGSARLGQGTVFVESAPAVSVKRSMWTCAIWPASARPLSR